jgi:hypothetical protein
MWKVASPAGPLGLGGVANVIIEGSSLLGLVLIGFSEALNVD